jgi:hypothetical protein
MLSQLFSLAKENHENISVTDGGTCSPSRNPATIFLPKKQKNQGNRKEETTDNHTNFVTRKSVYSTDVLPKVLITKKYLFEINAVHKNKIFKVNIPEGTQLVEKGKDINGQTIYAFHIYNKNQMRLFTTTEI